MVLIRQPTPRVSNNSSESHLEVATIDVERCGRSEHEEAEMIVAKYESTKSVVKKKSPRECFTQWKSTIRPWIKEFFSLSDFACVSKPSSWLKRVKKNVVYFLPNYLFIALILVLCSILVSFWLLMSTVVLCLLLYAVRRITKKSPVMIGEEEIPPWMLYAIAVFISLPLFLFANFGHILYAAIGNILYFENKYISI
ncbi:hypothetical protein AB6A40_010502 [Gnathostoma spinigerum]|uniref:PRA1 family protein n=1 Tax=Gnathostoma spinigerum TaxID=75299 RepID=A0ABD6EVG5_9BILA